MPSLYTHSARRPIHDYQPPSGQGRISEIGSSRLSSPFDSLPHTTNTPQTPSEPTPAIPGLPLRSVNSLTQLIACKTRKKGEILWHQNPRGPAMMSQGIIIAVRQVKFLVGQSQDHLSADYSILLFISSSHPLWRASGFKICFFTGPRSGNAASAGCFSCFGRCVCGWIKRAEIRGFRS